MKINIQRDEGERERDSPSCEQQRADKTHARDESTEARFPRLLAAAAAASGGAFKRTLANRCILDGCDFSAGVVVQRVKKDRTSIVRRKSRVFRLITCEYYQVKADVPPCGPSAFR